MPEVTHETGGDLMPSSIGVAQLPEFEESLRLLVQREKYTLLDIALMFGVSRERIRQLCVRYKITVPMWRRNGVNRSIRIWDDTEHRFNPVMCETLRKERSAEYWREKKALRADRQAWMIQEIKACVASLDHTPSYTELCEYLTGVRTKNGLALLLNMWDGNPKRSTKKRYQAFLKATGFKPRPAGGAGHMSKSGIDK